MRSQRAWIAILFVLLAAAAVTQHRRSTLREPSSILQPPSTTRYRGPHPNSVFVILIDTVRADRLSCYGYRAHETPNADRLAAGGVRFDNAWSTASWTRPSVGAIFTSLYPTQLGLVERPAPAGKHWAVRERREQLSVDLPEDETTLAEVLHRAGFTTAAFVNQPALNNQQGFQQGFDDWYYPSSMDEVRRLDPSTATTVQSWLSIEYADRADALLADAFDRWLADHAGDSRLFGYVHFLTPHRPYLPKPPYAPTVTGRKPTDSELYDGEVRMADALLGRVLDSIEQRRGEDGTLIVFVSDHGEEFKDHGMMEHGHSLHREVTRVPLIMRSPLLPAGKVVHAPVRNIDIMPTIVDLAGLKCGGMMGVSTLSLIHGGGPELPVYSEAMLYGSTERSLISGGYKLMYDAQGVHWRLFDLRNDPLELHDLSNEELERLQELRQELQRAHLALNRGYLHRLEHYEHRLSPEQRKENEKRAKEALKALGYID